MTEQDAQLARAALQLLGRAQVQMSELDVAVAVRNWLVEMANRQGLPSHLNGAEERTPGPQ